LCRRVGLYVLMSGAGLEDQTGAMNVQLNVCSNKKLSYNVVVAVAWIAHAELQLSVQSTPLLMPNKFFSEYNC